MEIVPKTSALHDQYTVLRYLKDCQDDLGKAKDKLLKSLKWREDNNVDNILEDFPKSPFFEPLEKYWPSCYIESDKLNDVIFYERMGEVDVKSLLSYFPVDVLELYHIYLYEQHDKRRKALDVKNNRRTNIILFQDASSASLKLANKAAISVMRRLEEIDNNYYPGLMDKIYIIDPPSLFSGLWKMLSPFLSEHTLNKITMIKHDELFKIYDRSIVPRIVGGENDTPISKGGAFDARELFPQIKSYKVSSKSVYEEKVIIPSDSDLSNTKISYFFSSEKYDIGFQILYKQNENSSDSITILENQRYNSHEKTIMSSIEANRPGVYILQWDNTYSTLRSKTIIYLINIVQGSYKSTSTIDGKDDDIN